MTAPSEVPIASGSDLKIITEEEVNKHSSNEDCWLIIGNDSNGKICYNIYTLSLCIDLCFYIDMDILYMMYIVYVHIILVHVHVCKY